MEINRNINPNIFREYDIRGIYPSDINESVAYTFGKAYGTYIKKYNQNKCIVGHDNRLSSQAIVTNLIDGILSTGIDVVYLDLVTTPMFYYACILKGLPAGIMVTASHNPKEYNGFKFSFDETGNVKGKDMEKFHRFIEVGDFDNGKGELTNYSIKEEYYRYLLSCIDINKDRKLKVVIDCGNGTTSPFAPELYSMTNIDLAVIYGRSDGSFPNHHPDPCVEENLKVLKDTVVTLKADLGIAFDGDGDRVGFVDEKGNYISTDEFMTIVVRNILPKSDNKKVLYDVKCSRILSDELKKLDATPVLCRTGNSFTKYYTKKQDCIFGGEYSGHVYFRDKFLGIDSGMYNGLRMIEMLSNTNKKASELLDGTNKYYSTPEIKIESTEEVKKIVVDSILEECNKQGFKCITIDGVRCEFSDGWALIRYSNTGPNITARFEAKTQDTMNSIKNYFMKLIEEYNVFDKEIKKETKEEPIRFIEKKKDEKYLIAMDLDGTLLDEKKMCSEKTISYLKKLKKDGHIIAIATGRVYETVRPLFKDLSFANFLIFNNGSAIYDVDQNKIIYHKELNTTDLYKLLPIIYSRSTGYELFNSIRDYRFVNNTSYDVVKKSIDNCVPLNGVLFYIKDDVNIDMFCNYLNENSETTSFFVMQDSFDTRKWIQGNFKDITKYSGIMWLQEKFDIELKNVITFGDGTNDIEMIRKCYNGVAMNNALPEVKEKAKYVTLSNEEDGVYEFLKSFIEVR